MNTKNKMITTAKPKEITPLKQDRKHHSPEFKEQAQARAIQDGVAQTVKDLGLAERQFYGWRAKARLTGQTGEEQRLQQSEHAWLKREVVRLEDRERLPKKGGGVLREAAQVKYAMIRAHEDQLRVLMMCRVLRVLSSGYYEWRDRKASSRAQARTQLDTKCNPPSRPRSAVRARHAWLGG